MEVFSVILGTADQPEHHEVLHRLAHVHAVDVLRLPRTDLARRRLRAVTESGRTVAIALPRTETLFDGALLELTDRSALVVRVETERWLRLAPVSRAAALRLGYACGNLHWRVRFDADHLLVAIEGEEAPYLDRLSVLFEAGDIAVVAEGAGAQ